MKVKLLFYNTHLFGNTVPGTYIGGQGFHDNERKDAIYSYIKTSEADIVCLCEVWDVSYKRDIIKNLENHYPYSCYNLASSFITIGSGLMILSKHELYNTDFIGYKYLSGMDYFAQKGVLHTSVYLNSNQQFRVFFTHNQAVPDPYHYREKNAAFLSDLTKKYHPNLPAIIIGDLNIYSDSKEYQNMMLNLNDYQDADSETQNQITYDIDNNFLANRFKNSEDRTGKLDYILFSRNDWIKQTFEIKKEWKIMNNVDCSDHYPVISELTFLHQESIIPRELRTDTSIVMYKSKHTSNSGSLHVDSNIGKDLTVQTVLLVSSIKYTNSLLNNDRLIEVVSQFSSNKKVNARIYNQLINLSNDPEIRDILIEEIKRNGEKQVVDTLFGPIKNTHTIKLPALEYDGTKDQTSSFSAIENGPIISNSHFPEPEHTPKKYFKLADIFYKAGMSFKVLDILADGTKVIYEPTLYNTKKVLVDYTHIYSMYNGVNTYSVLYSMCLSGKNIFEQIQQGEYNGALKEAAVTTSYMLLPSMVGYVNIPYLGAMYTATVTTQLAYSSFVKLHSFYQEYNTDEFNLRSSIAYKELYDSLSNSPIRLIYDFSYKIKEYKIKINNLNLEKDKINLKQELEQKGEFGQKLYQFIYEPELKEKYDLLNKIIDGSLAPQEAENLKARHIQLTIININYDECIERLSLKTETADHYYCYNENNQVIDHIVIGEMKSFEVIERL